jgi:hypothetical protein
VKWANRPPCALPLIWQGAGRAPALVTVPAVRCQYRIRERAAYPLRQLRNVGHRNVMRREKVADLHSVRAYAYANAQNTVALRLLNDRPLLLPVKIRVR